MDAGFEKGSQTVVLGGALIAGFFASACSLPFDFVKTRIQKMQPLPDGSFPYKGPVDCALKTLAQEGPLKFYTGFPTYCIRCSSPQNSCFASPSKSFPVGCRLPRMHAVRSNARRRYQRLGMHALAKGLQKGKGGRLTSWGCCWQDCAARGANARLPGPPEDL